MTAESQLQQAYDRWQSLALAEGEAIRARDWNRLALCQYSLQQLQPQITRCIQQTRQEWAQLGALQSDRERTFRVRTSALIKTARHNQALLQQARDAAVAQLSNFRQATRTLRRLRASYAPAAEPAWTSFS